MKGIIEIKSMELKDGMYEIHYSVDNENLAGVYDYGKTKFYLCKEEEYRKLMDRTQYFNELKRRDRMCDSKRPWITNALPKQGVDIEFQIGSKEVFTGYSDKNSNEDFTYRIHVTDNKGELIAKIDNASPKDYPWRYANNEQKEAEMNDWNKTELPVEGRHIEVDMGEDGIRSGINVVNKKGNTEFYFPGSRTKNYVEIKLGCKGADTYGIKFDDGGHGHLRPCDYPWRYSESTKNANWEDTKVNNTINWFSSPSYSSKELGELIGNLNVTEFLSYLDKHFDSNKIEEFLNLIKDYDKSKDIQNLIQTLENYIKNVKDRHEVLMEKSKPESSKEYEDNKDSRDTFTLGFGPDYYLWKHEAPISKDSKDFDSWEDVLRHSSHGIDSLQPMPKNTCRIKKIQWTGKLGDASKILKLHVDDLSIRYWGNDLYALLFKNKYIPFGSEICWLENDKGIRISSLFFWEQSNE